MAKAKKAKLRKATVKKTHSSRALPIKAEDVPTAERKTKGRAFDDTGTGASAIPGKVDSIIYTHEAVDGKVVRVPKSADTLDLMLRNGTINEDEAYAGRTFQGAFDLSNKSSIGGVNLDSVRGAVNKEAFVDLQIDASENLKEYTEVVGGDKSLGALVMLRVVGQGYSINQMIQCYSHGAHVWRGALITALQTLTNYLSKKHARRNKGVRSKSKATSNT